MILAAMIAMDIPTALDIASTYADEHDKVCTHDGTCAPLPWPVDVAFHIIRVADAAGMIPSRMGIG